MGRLCYEVIFSVRGLDSLRVDQETEEESQEQGVEEMKRTHFKSGGFRKRDGL